MTPAEFEIWKQDAKQALLNKYNEEDTNRILEWFTYFDGADEELLVGRKGTDAMQVFFKRMKPFDLYNSLMARIWLYAPYILEIYEVKR